MSVPALQRSLRDVVEEYDAKRAGIPDAIAAYQRAVTDLQSSVSVGGSFGDTLLRDSLPPSQRAMDAVLLKSAWRHVYGGLQIDRLATAIDKRRFQALLADPPGFTIPNLRERFGPYLLDPRHHILRGLAEVFCDLDPAYRSHSKVKIGVASLPKRVILSSVGGYGAWGSDRLRDVLNALAAYQGLPLIEWGELAALLADGNALVQAKEIPQKYGAPITTVARGVRLKRFANGNGHLHFEPDTLKDINRALAEFYGEVLPDCEDDRPAKPRASTAVSTDLQYYPTPEKVAESVVSDIYFRDGDEVLEPSCGCGRILDVLSARRVKAFGIEVDHSRAEQCRRKGHKVLSANFLETVPDPRFSHVVMNPPFWGQHYAKHVEHARKYLRPGGVLTAILPSTARYDHGLLDGRWKDLPVGSFSESGTNINTSVLTMVAA